MKEKVTTPVWLPHAAQISRDIYWTPSCLVPLMKTESRVMEFNRIHQSTVHRSFPSKEEQICHPGAGCHDNGQFPQSEADKLFCSVWVWSDMDWRRSNKNRQSHYGGGLYNCPTHSLKNITFSSSKLPGKCA